MNPFLLKELRQSVRSRLVSGSLIGFFALLLVILGTIFAAASDAPNPDLGPVAFGVVAGVLVALGAFVIPFAAFQRLCNERAKTRADLLFTTPLPPRSIVDGKLLAALAMSLLFLSAALPFLVLSYELHGVDLLDILLFAGAYLALSALLVAAGLVVAASSAPHVARRVVFVLFLVQVFFPVFVTSIGFVSGEFSLDLSGLAVAATVWLAALLLVRALAIFSVSPAGTDRARPFRRSILAIWLGITALLAAIALLADDPDISGTCAVLLLMAGLGLSTVVLLNALLLPKTPSHRTLLEIRPRHRFRQFLLATTAEGGMLLGMFLLAASFAAFLPFRKSSAMAGFDPDCPALLCTVLYYTSFLLLLRFVLTAIHRTFPSYAVLALAVLFPQAWSVVTLAAANGDPCYVPGNLYAALSHHDTLPAHFLMSCVFFAAAFLLYLPSVLRSYRSFRRPDAPPALPSAPSETPAP